MAYMQKKPRISVIVPALNAEKTVEDCIKSLLNQQYSKGEYEIIVVDNGSTDNTLKILQEFRKRIRILKEPKKGSYCARNKGLKNVRGDIIAFTDSDCVVDKDWLLYIIKTFEDKHIKLVGGNIRALKTDKVLLRYFNIFGHPQALSFKSTIPFFATANMAIRKKCLKQSGVFNESLESGGDVEFCSRLIKNKKEIYYEPRAVVKHFYDDSIIKFMKKQYYYGKWHKFRKQKLGLDNTIQMPGLIQILIKYGIIFFFLRVLQDLPYNFGTCFGKTN